MRKKKEPKAKRVIFKNDKTLEEYWELGFLLPSILYLDAVIGTQRWAWWQCAHLNQELPTEPYNKVEWCTDGTGGIRKTVEKLLDCTVYCDLDSFLDFLLYGCGDKDATSWMTEQHKTILQWEATLHEVLPLMVKNPYPYFSAMLEEMAGRRWRQGTGFFCTPMSLCQLMARMMYGEEGDITQSVNDCACGTGNLLLAASDYSVNLYGQDISATVLKGLKLHGFLYAPWLVRPFPAAWLAAYKEKRECIARVTAMLAAIREMTPNEDAASIDKEEPITKGCA